MDSVPVHACKSIVKCNCTLLCILLHLLLEGSSYDWWVTSMDVFHLSSYMSDIYMYIPPIRQLIGGGKVVKAQPQIIKFAHRSVCLYGQHRITRIFTSIQDRKDIQSKCSFSCGAMNPNTSWCVPSFVIMFSGFYQVFKSRVLFSSMSNEEIFGLGCWWTLTI